MDILDFFWTFYLNHLSPLWGYFLIFSSQGDNDNGHEGGGVAEDAGGKEEKG